MTDNFFFWILRRVWYNLRRPWRNILYYRTALLEEPVEAIIMTLLAGSAWIMLGLIIFFFVSSDNTNEEMIKTVVFWQTMAVIVFYIYNLLMALYSAYLKEKIRCPRN